MLGSQVAVVMRGDDGRGGDDGGREMGCVSKQGPPERLERSSPIQDNPPISHRFHRTLAAALENT